MRLGRPHGPAPSAIRQAGLRTSRRAQAPARAITDGEYHAVVYDVAVHPEYQGRGIGKELMSRMLSSLRVWRLMLGG